MRRGRGYTSSYNIPNLPIIAEDLGVITPDVKELIHLFGFPGMKVILFAFDENVSRNPYAPHNHVKNCDQLVEKFHYLFSSNY